MSKVDIKRLDSVTKNDTTATEQINDNFQALQVAIENTVSRDGTVPNYMDADLDLNSYRIINAGAPVEGKDVVTLEYFEEKAGGAIEAAAEAKASASKAASSAQSALVASNNAIGQLAQAESLLLSAETQLTDTIQYVDAAKADIDATVEAGKQEINTTIDDAQMSLSDTINQAVEDVKTEAVNAANAVIEEAGATATQIATNNINDYTMNTVVPQLNTFVESTEADAKSADEDAKAAEDWAKTSKIWATGEDAEVNTVAPGEEEHSSRGYADLAMAIANTPEDVPVDTSKLLALDVIRGPKGDSGEAEFSGDVTFTGTFDVHSDSNHPVKVTGMAGTSASGFQIADSNGLGDSDFEHYATGDRYGTRITNHNNTSDTSVSVDLYQSNVGKSVLDASAVDTVLIPTAASNSNDTTAANTAWVNTCVDSKMNNAVKTSGDQTISGVKTFKDIVVTEKDYFRRATNITLGTAPSSNQYASYKINDKNDKQIANFYVSQATNNNMAASMIATNVNSSTGASFDSAIRVVATPSGQRYTEAPASDMNNSIVTTVNKSKAQNGYFKLGNGLIIQWGYTTSNNSTVTFPTAFTAVPSITFGGLATGGSADYSIVYKSISATNFSVAWAGSAYTGTHWIAVGY